MPLFRPNPCLFRTQRPPKQAKIWQTRGDRHTGVRVEARTAPRPVDGGWLSWLSRDVRCKARSAALSSRSILQGVVRAPDSRTSWLSAVGSKQLSDDASWAAGRLSTSSILARKASIRAYQPAITGYFDACCWSSSVDLRVRKLAMPPAALRSPGDEHRQKPRPPGIEPGSSA